MPELVAIDHVQLAIPMGGEADARRFYVGVLGFVEIPKPAPLAARGGAWFQLGPIALHVGVEQDFVAAKKAHPAFRVASRQELDAWSHHFRIHNIDVRWSDELPDVFRFHVDDCFGNRLEFTT